VVFLFIEKGREWGQDVLVKLVCTDIGAMLVAQHYLQYNSNTQCEYHTKYRENSCAKAERKLFNFGQRSCVE
jgi:hypothetical protein